MIEEKKIEKYFSKNELNMQYMIDDYYNYIRTIIKNFKSINIEDEEEIVADVFFIIWKNKEILDRKLKLSPYIAGIIKNIIYKKYKETRINTVYEEMEENIESNFNVEKLLEEKELNDCIIKKLKSIGENEYLVFTKFYYQDKKIKDISNELGLSISNTKTILHRTRKKVKEFLKMGGLY